MYRLAAAAKLTNPDLIPIALRIPRSVVCLISALAHHGLTTQVPHSVDIALLSHAQIPKIDGIPVRVFWYSEPSFSAGIGVRKVDGVPIRIYSPEKTITDCFKYRNKIGVDLVIEALRSYRERQRKPDFRSLSHFAKINRVQRIMEPYLRRFFEWPRHRRVRSATTPFVHGNKVAVFDKNQDLMYSNLTRTLSNAVKGACVAITAGPGQAKN